MRLWIKYFMFFSSFSPLFFILLIRNLEIEGEINLDLIKELVRTGYYFNLVMFILGTIPLIVLIILVNKKSSSIGNVYKVEKVIRKNHEVLNYIATYLIPFATFSTAKLNDIIALYLLLIILSIVYVEANNFFMNPVLILFGYKIVEVITEQGKSIIVICKKSALEDVKTMNLVSIFKDLYLEVGDK